MNMPLSFVIEHTTQILFPNMKLIWIIKPVL